MKRRSCLPCCKRKRRVLDFPLPSVDLCDPFSIVHSMSGGTDLTGKACCVPPHFFVPWLRNALARSRDCAPRFARASLLTNNNKQQNEYDRDALDRATRQDPSRMRSSRFEDEQMERNRTCRERRMTTGRVVRYAISHCFSFTTAANQ